MRNLNFWSKIVLVNFWSSQFSRLLRSCRNERKWICKKKSFCWFSSNSEVETTWASLICWPHKTSNIGRLLSRLTSQSREFLPGALLQYFCNQNTVQEKGICLMLYLQEWLNVVHSTLQDIVHRLAFIRVLRS